MPLSVPTGVVYQLVYKTASVPNAPNVPKLTSILNTDAVLSVPNATAVPVLSVPTGVQNVKCAKVNQMYQNGLGVLNTDPIPCVPNVPNVPNVPK